MNEALLSLGQVLTVGETTATVRVWLASGGVVEVELPALGLQLLAVGAIGLYANNKFGFYDDWDDVLGVQAPPPAVIDTAGLVAGDGSQGRVVAITAPISQ